MNGLLPDGLGLLTGLGLVALSGATSFLTAAVGIGGGAVLIAVMAVLMPIHALVPVHGLVQLGSNAGRAAIMARHVERHILLPFGLGGVLGAGVGGMIVIQLPASFIEIALAAFILWSTFGPAPTALGRLALSGAGALSTFLTMFFGATGSFVAGTLKSLRLGRLEHVASHSACMTLQHGIKVVTFGLLGFAYGPWLPLIGAMIVSGLLGTLLGKRLLVRTGDERFHQVLSIVLTLLALRLLWSGTSALVSPA